MDKVHKLHLLSIFVCLSIFDFLITWVLKIIRKSNTLIIFSLSTKIFGLKKKKKFHSRCESHIGWRWRNHVKYRRERNFCSLRANKLSNYLNWTFTNSFNLHQGTYQHIFDPKKEALWVLKFGIPVVLLLL